MQAPTIPLHSISNRELRDGLSVAVDTERVARAGVVAHLAELDRRKLYLEDACSSLFSYCTERLGYSEDEAFKRVRVARLVQRVPRVLEELESGAIHLSGLFVLARYLTEENADALLAEARGKPKRAIEELVARWFPQADVPPSIVPQTSGHRHHDRIEPLSAASYRIEFTASAELRDKLMRARDLLSHVVPSGDLAQVIERAIDGLIATETKLRSGVGKPRKRRLGTLGTRHVPLEVARAVRERDGNQCTFVDAQGRRCSETRFVTIEHIEPYARGGPATVENCCLLCAPHNAYRARRIFGEAHVRKKIAQARARKTPASERKADGHPPR